MQRDFSDYIREINQWLRRIHSGFYTTDGVTLKKLVRYDCDTHTLVFLTKEFSSQEECLQYVQSIVNDSVIHGREVTIS